MLAVGICAAALTAFAQTKEFPARPVRVVVPVPPAGSPDVMARIVSPKWGEIMGQNVIIDYRPGANTIVGSEHVARAPAATPAPVVKTLNDTITRAMCDPALAERFDKEGAVIVAGSSSDLAAHVGAELALWAKVVKSAGLRID